MSGLSDQMYVQFLYFVKQKGIVDEFYHYRTFEFQDYNHKHLQTKVEQF